MSFQLLPNELLALIAEDTFPEGTVGFASTCKHFHEISKRLLREHQTLQKKFEYVDSTSINLLQLYSELEARPWVGHFFRRLRLNEKDWWHEVRDDGRLENTDDRRFGHAYRLVQTLPSLVRKNDEHVAGYYQYLFKQSELSLKNFSYIALLLMLPRLNTLCLRGSQRDEVLLSGVAESAINDDRDRKNVLPKSLTIEQLPARSHDFMKVQSSHIEDLIKFTALPSMSTLKGYMLDGKTHLYNTSWQSMQFYRHPGQLERVELTRVGLHPEKFGEFFGAMEKLSTLGIAYRSFHDMEGGLYSTDSMNHNAASLINRLSNSFATRNLRELSLTFSDQDDQTAWYYPKPIKSLKSFKSLRKLEIDASFLAPELFCADLPWSLRQKPDDDDDTWLIARCKTTPLVHLLPVSVETIRLGARMVKLSGDFSEEKRAYELETFFDKIDHAGTAHTLPNLNELRVCPFDSVNRAVLQAWCEHDCAFGWIIEESRLVAQHTLQWRVGDGTWKSCCHMD